MKKQTNAEVHVLNRIMYMLEEQSVSHLAQKDIGFADFIDQVYTMVLSKADALQHTTV